MNTCKRGLSVMVMLLAVVVFAGMPGRGYCAEPPALSEAGGGSWSDSAVVLVTEPTGAKRIDEPVEVVLVSDKVKPQGEDIRVTDAGGGEIPCQVSVTGTHMYRIAFIAQAEANASGKYQLYYGNQNAGKPNYGFLNSIVNNSSKFWQTDGAYIGWGGRAGFDISGKNAITVLKFDNNNDRNLSNDPDCLTDELAWAWFYGYLGSNPNAGDPCDFGASQAQLVENGPVFSEIALGTARLRYYKDQKWIVANGAADSVFCFNKNYQFMKDGLGGEVSIPNLGSGDLPYLLTGYYSNSVNPKYLAFRNPTTGLVFGAVAKDVAHWYMAAKFSGAWDRIISFDDSSSRADAKIYWYSDTTNSYQGIENLSKRLLNPLQVELVTDAEPPTTSASVTPLVPDGEKGWYVTTPQVILAADEPGTTYYRVDDGAETVYSAAFTVPEGTHTITYYSVDAAKNREQEKTLRLKVDSSPPEISAGIFPKRQGNYCFINEPITISFDATDTISGPSSTTATVDGRPILDGEELRFGKPGEYALKVACEDFAGNAVSMTETIVVGYDVAWLSASAAQDDAGNTLISTEWYSSIPLRFTVRNGVGDFVEDRTVRVVISDGGNTAAFTYGKTSPTVRINPCDEKYLLYVYTKNYPWLTAGGTYTVSVYFGGSNGAPIILHDVATLKLY